MGKKIGQYELQRKIAVGRFGVVYQGCNTSVDSTQTGATVALKAIPHKGVSAGVMRRFEWEIKALQRLNSPLLVRVYDVLKAARFVYVVMELCRGGDLQARVKDAGGLDEDTAGRWAVYRLLGEVVEATLHLQDKRVIARDPGPTNILLTDSNLDNAHVKVANFSAFRSIYFNSLIHTTCGNPLFLAPEVINDQEFTPQADTWSLGVLAYYTLTGQSPFQATSVSDLKEVMRSPVTFPEELPLSQSAKETIFRMLRYSPSLRPTLSDLRTAALFRSNAQVLAATEECGDFEIISVEESYPDLALQYMDISAIEEHSPLSASLVGEDLTTAFVQTMLELESELVQSEGYLRLAEGYERKAQWTLAAAACQQFADIVDRMSHEVEVVRTESGQMHPLLGRFLQRLIETALSTKEKLSRLKDSSVPDASLMLLESTAFALDETAVCLETQRLLRAAESESQRQLKVSQIREALRLVSIVVTRSAHNADADRLLSQASEALVAATYSQ